MRIDPQTRGRCHNADYVGDTELPTILVPDVGRPHAVSMPDESTAFVRATEDAAGDLAPPMPAHETCPAGERLFL